MTRPVLPGDSPPAWLRPCIAGTAGRYDPDRRPSPRPRITKASPDAREPAALATSVVVGFLLGNALLLAGTAAILGLSEGEWASR